MFIRNLRQSLEAEGLIPTAEFLDFLRRQRRRIALIHIKLSQMSSGGMASAMYQDGLLHALDDVLSCTLLGTKRNKDFDGDLNIAAKAVRQSRKKDNFVEVAYWTGRHEVVERFCDRDDTAIPAYFHPNQLVPVARFVKGRQF
jgi:hypothetical protein